MLNENGISIFWFLMNFHAIFYRGSTVAPPLIVHKNCFCSASSSTLWFLILFSAGHSHECEGISHCGVAFLFPNSSDFFFFVFSCGWSTPSSPEVSSWLGAKGLLPAFLGV